MPYQQENNMDNSSGTRKRTAFEEMLYHAYLRRRAPSEAQLAQSLSHESFFESDSLSIRKISVLPNRRIWLLVAYEASSLSRSIIWGEPIFSTIGRTVAKGALSLWNRHLRIGAVHRRIRRLNNANIGIKWASPGVLSHESETRYRLLCREKARQIS